MLKVTTSERRLDCFFADTVEEARQFREAGGQDGRGGIFRTVGYHAPVPCNYPAGETKEEEERYFNLYWQGLQQAYIDLYRRAIYETDAQFERALARFTFEYVKMKLVYLNESKEKEEQQKD